VISFTRWVKFSLPITITCLHPAFLASATFSSLPTVPITVAPSAFAHWHRMRPTPPAAACIRIVSPAFTR